MNHLDDRYLILGLAGRAGAGKDTGADVLCEAHQFYRFAFADPVRKEITDAFCIDPALFLRPYKEHKTAALAVDRCTDRNFVTVVAKLGQSIAVPRSPREIMRWWATEYRRAQNPHYWTRKAGDTLHDALRRGFRRVVITDVRFKNEADFIRYHGGRVWMISRASSESAPANHQSESELTSIAPDVVIENNRSMTAFAAEIMKTYRASHEQT